jgi:hypothetical protein
VAQHSAHGYGPGLVQGQDPKCSSKGWCQVGEGVGGGSLRNCFKSWQTLCKLATDFS